MSCPLWAPAGVFGSAPRKDAKDTPAIKTKLLFRMPLNDSSKGSDKQITQGTGLRCDQASSGCVLGSETFVPHLEQKFAEEGETVSHLPQMRFALLFLW